MSDTSRRALLAALAAGVAGCSTGRGTTTRPTTGREPTTRTAAGTTAAVDRRTDVPFRETPERTLRLDLYLPPEGDDHPFFVFAHGGGWITGDKRQRPMFPAMAEAGIAVADIQYRLADERRYPAAVRDTAAAVRWVRANAAEYGVDPERGALGGYSAGAHLAALVGFAPDHGAFQPREFHPEVPVAVDAVVGYSGPYAFTVPGAGENRFVEAFFGPDAPDSRLREGSPVTHVDAGDPPAMLVHGTDDRIVPYRSTTVLAEALREADVEVEVFTGEGAGHGLIGDPEFRERTLPAQRAFLERHLRS